MEIFIGNLPDEATVGEINAIFKDFGKRANFKIVRKNLPDGVQLRYCYGVILPDKAAQKAVKKFNKKMLHGSRLVVREFHHRTYFNERRAIDWRTKPWSGAERRSLERRQSGELENHAEPQFRGYRNLAVKHV